VSGYFDAAPRRLTTDVTEIVRALVVSSLGVTPYVDRVLELLGNATAANTETRGLVIERDGTVAAMGLYGPVAGTSGTWDLAAVLVAPGVEAKDVGRRLLDAVLDEARREGGRMIVAELPGDPAWGASLTLLRASAFRQVGRIADFHRDGVSRLFLRRTL
jgi:GNAT superfamily N-acetyltransferase